MHKSLESAEELAERLGVRPATILAWHRAGRIPGRRLTHKVLRFNFEDVVEALERGQSVLQMTR